jgi:putative addiction module component (TIGR02574 family)
MTQRSIDLFNKALTSTEEERAELAASLLSSRDEAPNASAESAWKDEISQRISNFDSSLTRTIPWDDVKSHVSTSLAHGQKKR